MIQFDDTERTLRLNVNDLVRAESDPWDGAWESPVRARLGTEIHSAYFAAHRADGYRAEAAVSLELERRGYRVRLEGRLDGMYDSGAGMVVEELKSVDRPGPVPANTALIPAHAEQCGFYCLLVHRSGSTVERGIVRYISADDLRGREFDIEFCPADYDALLETRLARIMDAHVADRRTAAARAEYAERMRFPFREIRGGQEAMLHAAEAAAGAGQFMLCSAPTGIGKTAAALYALTRQALRRNRPLFFVTAKVSQQKLAMDTLRRMLEPGSEVLALQLMAKDRSCPLEEMHCGGYLCPYLADFPRRFAQSGMAEEFLRSGVAEGEAIRERALAHGLCPFEASLELSLRASVIVGDYNYVFEPRASLKRFFEGAGGDYLLVVDEAHNLPARTTDYYSPELDVAELQRLGHRCAAVRGPLFADVAALFVEIADYYRRSLDELNADRRAAPPYAGELDRRLFEELGGRVEELLSAYFLYVATEGPRPLQSVPVRQRGHRRYIDPLLAALFAVRDFCSCASADPDLFAAIWEPEDRLKILCLDPAPFLAASLKKFHAALFMSATLTPFDFYTRMLGLEGFGTTTLDLASPFPKENRLILTVKAVDTTYRTRSRDAQAIADLIAGTLLLKPGNYLAFFSSFAFRDEVVAKLAPGPFRLILQQPAMKTGPVLKELEQNLTGTILLCAVQGGVFSEGVDYPDHLAVGAFVVGPGLPTVSLEQELIRDHFDLTLGAGFEYAYVYPGVNRSVQAGGRVIRTPSDRGFVMLICRRFTQPLYFAKLPAYWREEMIVADDPREPVRAFWEGSAPPRPAESAKRKRAGRSRTGPSKNL